MEGGSLKAEAGAQGTRLCWSQCQHGDVAVVLVCRASAELFQERGGSHGARGGGQDRVNWVPPHSSSSQIGPMVSHPPQSLSALEWLPDERMGPEQTGAPAFVHM